MSLSDQKLIAQVLSGKTESYDVLVKRNEKQIYRYTREINKPFLVLK